MVKELELTIKALFRTKRYASKNFIKREFKLKGRFQIEKNMLGTSLKESEKIVIDNFITKTLQSDDFKTDIQSYQIQIWNEDPILNIQIYAGEEILRKLKTNRLIDDL